MARVNRAIRPFFAPSRRKGCAFYEEDVSFDWHSGMSWQVRQRSSDSMANAIMERYASKGLLREEILEVSTASHDYGIGQALSAMNLAYRNPSTNEVHPVENWFQASKVFQGDAALYGPFTELLNVPLAKRYVNPYPDKKMTEKLRNDQLFQKIQTQIQGQEMCRFELDGVRYPLVPRSAFYDYLYVSALLQPQNDELARSLLGYRVFTDIMFNPGKGKHRRFNTQARSCAIFVSLTKRGALEDGVPQFREFVDAVAYPSEIGRTKTGRKSLFSSK